MSLPTPFYDQDGCTIFVGDCRDILPHLPKVDLVVTSPPYNKGRQSGDYANMRNGYASFSDDMEDAEYCEWQRSILLKLWENVFPNGAIFYNHKPALRNGCAILPTRLIPDGCILRQVIVWDRGGGMNWNASFFCPQHEWIMLIAHKEFRLSSRSHSSAGDVWSIPIDHLNEGHPCAFPIGIPQRAIDATDAKVILDPFMGSGTTLRAAKDLGRRAIGIEISEAYAKIAVERLRQGVLNLA